MSANLDAYATPRASVIARSDMNKRLKKIEDEIAVMSEDIVELTVMLYSLIDKPRPNDIEKEITKR